MDIEAATGVKVCGPAYGYGSFTERSWEGIHVSPGLLLGILRMTQLPMPEKPDWAQQS